MQKGTGRASTVAAARLGERLSEGETVYMPKGHRVKWSMECCMGVCGTQTSKQRIFRLGTVRGIQWNFHSSYYAEFNSASTCDFST